MTRYLISFPSGAMDHIPAEEFPAVGEAAHAVVQEAMDAGVLVFGGGLAENVDPVMVAGDGTITAGTYPQTKEFNGGFTVLDVTSREAALEWAAKIAAACRCAQEIREFVRGAAEEAATHVAFSIQATRNAVTAINDANAAAEAKNNAARAHEIACECVGDLDDALRA